MSGHRYNRESARAAGLKGLAGRTPEQQSEIARKAAQTRWANHERKTAPAELPAGPERAYWVEQVAVRYPDEFGRLTPKALVRRATMLARIAAAQAAVDAAQPPTDTPFALLRAKLKAGKR